MAEPIGNLLDSLGVAHTPEDGEMVSDALVLLKVVDAEGYVSLRVAWSDGMSWIERLGMLRAAEANETPRG
jgi:hypothetical protein